MILTRKTNGYSSHRGSEIFKEELGSHLGGDITYTNSLQIIGEKIKLMNNIQDTWSF